MRKIVLKTSRRKTTVPRKTIREAVMASKLKAESGDGEHKIKLVTVTFRKPTVSKNATIANSSGLATRVSVPKKASKRS